MAMLTDLVRALRAVRGRWTKQSDREFHDVLFAAHRHDPFSPAYTGNITIRRFADLAAPAAEASTHVLDVGCGLGEITCELARRYPNVRFLGVDHSRAGIEGARRNAERLGLSNISFEVQDMEQFVPEVAIDLVMMFDSFHHLLDPRAFVKRMARHTKRFLLIEPQGDWKGSWVRTLDLDWLAQDLERIRVRLAHTVGEPQSSGSEAGDATSGEGENALAQPGPDGGHAQGQGAQEPVENRYDIDAFQSMFSGFGLSVRGTVAGLDAYPPDPTLDTRTRRDFGQLAYEMYRQVDEMLHDADLDLHAKHLVIDARFGAVTEIRAVRPLPETAAVTDLRGAYDVEYLGYEGPTGVAAEASWHAAVALRNASFRAFRSDVAEFPQLLSYHWWDLQRQVVVQDGRRSPLPGVVVPDQQVTVPLAITAPAEPGRYILAIDLVEEGKTWFHDAGMRPLEVEIRVRRESAG